MGVASLESPGGRGLRSEGGAILYQARGAIGVRLE